MELFAYLPQEDKVKIEKFVCKYGIEEENFIGLETWLKTWSKEKEKLYHLFGDSFTYSFDFDYKVSNKTYKEMLKRILTKTYIRQTFSTLVDDYYGKKIQEIPFDKDLRREYMLLNSLSDFSIPLAEEDMMGNDNTKVILLKDGKKFYIRKTDKKERVLRKFLKLTALDQTESGKEVLNGIDTYLNEVSANFANSNHHQGTITLSIHPLDFLTMSDNDYKWSSCLSWIRPGGCYRAGTLEMMNSGKVIVAYISGTKPFTFADDQKWNNKKWRCLFFVDEDIICSSKAYPYKNAKVEGIILDKLKELAEKNLNYSYSSSIIPYEDEMDVEVAEMSQFDNIKYKDDTFYQDIFPTIESKNNKRIFLRTKVMYNDIYNAQGTEYSCYRNYLDKEKAINLSGNVTCARCGLENIFDYATYDLHSINYEKEDDEEKDIYNNRYTFKTGKNILCGFCMSSYSVYCNKCGLLLSPHEKNHHEGKIYCNICIKKV